MRTPIFILFFCFATLILSSFERPKSSNACATVDAASLRNKLSYNIPDSIYQDIKDKPLIFYSSGHYGCIWSLVIYVEGNFKAVSGSTSSGEIIIQKPDGENMLDSTAFFTATRGILRWGLDSLMSEVSLLKPVERKEYSPIYTSISVFSGDSIISLDSYRAISFTGPGSVRFNEKYHRLLLIMAYLAEPYIRQYIKL